MPIHHTNQGENGFGYNTSKNPDQIFEMTDYTSRAIGFTINFWIKTWLG